jgi:hypothetical protein
MSAAPQKIRAAMRLAWLIPGVKLFYSGPVINTEMLVMMLEKHGIAATQEFAEPDLPEDDDLNRLARVLVPEAIMTGPTGCFTRNVGMNCNGIALPRLTAHTDK